MCCTKGTGGERSFLMHLLLKTYGCLGKHYCHTFVLWTLGSSCFKDLSGTCLGWMSQSIWHRPAPAGISGGQRGRGVPLGPARGSAVPPVVSRMGWGSWYSLHLVTSDGCWIWCKTPYGIIHLNGCNCSDLSHWHKPTGVQRNCISPL